MARLGLGAAILAGVVLLAVFALRGDPPAPAHDDAEAPGGDAVAPKLVGLGKDDDPSAEHDAKGPGPNVLDPYRVRFEVLMPDGTPAERATIRYAKTTQALVTRAGVPWGPHRPVLVLPNGVWVARAYLDMGSTLLRSQSVLLGPLSETARVQLFDPAAVAEATAAEVADLPPTGTVAGKVLLPDGFHVDRGQVFALPFHGKDPPDTAEIVYDTNATQVGLVGGTYVFRDLPRGWYRLVLAFSSRIAVTADVDVGGPSVRKDLRLPLELDELLPVLVLDAEGRPVTQDVTFRVEPVGEAYAGHRPLPAPVFRRDDGVLFVRPEILEGTKPTRFRVKVIVPRLGQRARFVEWGRDPTVLRFGEPVDVTVRVEGLPDALHARAGVHLELPGASLPAPFRSGETRLREGAASFRALQPGAYEAYLVLSLAGARSWIAREATILRTPIRVAPNATTFVMRVPDLHAVRLLGKTPPRAVLVVHLVRPDGTREPRRFVDLRRDTTMEHLTVGRYEAQLFVPGDKKAPRRWSFNVPETAELRLAED